MSERKTYVILGLGRFGSTLARQLTEYNQEVIAIDRDMALVEKVSPFVSNALCLDYTDVDALKAAGVEDADIGVVTTGTKLDQAIIGLMNLKELQIPYVLVKANDSKTAQLMMKVGADQIISPENDMAKKVAKRLISENILEIFDIDTDYSIFDLKVPENWIGSCLKQLDLRSKYSLNVVGLRRDNKLVVNVNPDEKFKENDELLVVAPNEILKNFDDLNKVKINKLQ